MSRKTPIDFNAPVPPELNSIEGKLIEFYRWSRLGLRIDVDASGLGAAYQPERGDIDERRQAIMPKIRDDEAMDISRALARVPENPIDWRMILRVHYLRQFQPPAIMCRKLRGVRAQTWVQERNNALHMVENIMRRGLHKIPIRLYCDHPAQSRETCIAD